MKIINQLSNRDMPSYFGLAENIERAWEKNISTEIISDIKGVYYYFFAALPQKLYLTDLQISN